MTTVGVPGIDAVPTGTIFPWAGDVGSLPSGWLACGGAAVSRTTYANLFTVLGTAYGAGDGSTTFNVPDLLGRTILGAGSGGSLTARARGDKSGAETVTISANNLPTHTHAGGGATGTQSANHTHTGTSGTESANHSHSITVNSASINHNHVIKTAANAASGSAIGTPDLGGAYSSQSTNYTDPSHNHSASSGTQSANHTHSTTTGNESANHTHADPTTGNNTTTATATSIVPPFGVATYIIKT